MGHDSPVDYTHWCSIWCFGWYEINKCVYLSAVSHRFELSSDVPTDKGVFVNGSLVFTTCVELYEDLVLYVPQVLSR